MVTPYCHSHVQRKYYAPPHVTEVKETVRPSNKRLLKTKCLIVRCKKDPVFKTVHAIAIADKLPEVVEVPLLKIKIVYCPVQTRLLNTGFRKEALLMSNAP